MSHIRRTSFYVMLDDEIPEQVFHHIVVRVGKSCGLRGIARQLQEYGELYYFLIEGYDYQCREYVSFFKTGSSAMGAVTRLKITDLVTVADMRLPPGFWCVKAQTTRVAETSSDSEMDGKQKLENYLAKRRRKK